MSFALPGGQPDAAGQAWSVRMANSVLKRHSPQVVRWHYEYGLMLLAIEQVWLKTGDNRYFRFVKDNIDSLVNPAGHIKGYNLQEYNLDQINPGKALFALHRTTGDLRYSKAIFLLRAQLRTQPRTQKGGFWHKKIYPHQMWLDGIYMACPFYAEFARSFDELASLDDIVHQITLIEQHTRDARSGLLYHGWDESRLERWADRITGCSPHFWGRAMGWYAMAIVDVLDHLPPDHPRRGVVTAIFERLASALIRVQDGSAGLWYQVLDASGREGNYLEASASSMFVYAIAKAVRQGYLASTYMDAARRGYRGLLERLIRVDDQGLVNLEGICSVAGLGGKPYRDGSYAYYVGEKIVTNDYKGIGPFILASLEMENI